MNFPDEQDLLRGARKYDLQTLGVVYDLYSPGIYRYAIRLLGDDFLSEECVADTFSRFLKMLHSGQGPHDHLQAYLYRIAHNWITDSYRRQPPASMELDDSVRVDDHFLPEGLADFQIERQQVRLALSSLTPDQRQVITLRFIEGWENEEVAAALGKPVGAIKALQFRALTTLRKLLVSDEKESVYETEN